MITKKKFSKKSKCFPVTSLSYTFLNDAITHTILLTKKSRSSSKYVCFTFVWGKSSQYSLTFGFYDFYYIIQSRKFQKISFEGSNLRKDSYTAVTSFTPGSRERGGDYSSNYTKNERDNGNVKETCKYISVD